MRILLFSGKGGDGKSTVAAATALRTAEAGLRTLVCSTDPAHSLADAFDDAALGDEPTPIATLGRGTLLGQQLHARARLEESWGEVREYLTALLDGGGARVVVAERLVVSEARRTFTYLSLFGYHVDAVIANRLLPDAIADPWFASWKGVQREHLDSIRAAFAPVPVITADLADHELVGVDHLSDFGAQLYGLHDAAARLSLVEPFRVVAAGEALVLSMQLPFTDRTD